MTYFLTRHKSKKNTVSALDKDSGMLICKTDTAPISTDRYCKLLSYSLEF